MTYRIDYPSKKVVHMIEFKLMVTTQKKLTVLFLSILIFSITIAVTDVVIMKNDGFGLSFAVAGFIALIGLPFLVVLSFGHGLMKVGKILLSKKETKSVKIGILERTIKLFIGAAIVLAIFGVINAAGTYLF